MPTDAVTNPHVVLVRRRFGPPPVPAIGYEIFVPEFEAPTVPLPVTDLDALARALGWPAALPVAARHARIDAVVTWGMVEPSAWERTFVAWVARELGAELLAPLGPPGFASAPAADAGRFVDLRARLHHLRPWASPAEVPEDVIVRRAATRRGEARAVARALRGWLVASLGEGIADPEVAARRCDEILVLVPDDPDRVDRFATELERADLPVRAHRRTPVLATGLGRWVLGLAELSGWGPDQARRRDLLEELALAPFTAVSRFPATAPARPSRRCLAELIASLRRPALELETWRRHVEALAAAADTSADPGAAAQTEPSGRAAQLRASGELLLALAEQLAPGPDLLARLQALVAGEARVALDRPGLHALPDDEPGKAVSRDALARIERELERLVQTEQAHAGHHPRLDSGRGLAALLHEALADAAVVTRSTPAHGVTVLPYSGYDGRECSLLVLAGLEEGGYPQVPRRPTRREATWLDRLGVLAGEADQLDARVDETVLAELERQIRVCDRALAATSSQVLLSFATEAGDGKATHPGALLSLLLGGWDERAWDAAPRERVAALTRADEAPASAAEARSWFELGHYPDALPPGSADDGPAQLADLADRHLALAGSRALQREHAPLEPGHPADAPFGPFTGRLPGRLASPARFSATAFESYSACPYSYFLRHVLGVRSSEVSGASLSPIEQGNLVHEALAELVHQTLADRPGASFDFLAPAAERGARIDAIVELARTKLVEHGAALADAEPSLSRALVEAVADRWVVALRRWLERSLQTSETLARDPEAIAASPAVAEALAELALLRQRDASHDAFATTIRTRTPATRAGWADAAKAEGLVAAAAGRAWKAWKDAGATVEAREEALADFRRADAEALAEAEDAVARAEASEQSRRSQTLARRQRFAELGFGDALAPGHDPASVAEPLDLAIGPARTVRLRGSVDRVDVDPAREGFAVLDYKTGNKPARRFAERLRTGEALQPTLYAMALEQLAAAGRLAPLAGLRAREVGYLYPRVAGEDTLDPRAGTGWRLADDPDERELTAIDITRIWVEHTSAAIEAGRFELHPVRCPKLGRGHGYCDVQAACRIQTEHLPNFAVPARPELVELRPKDGTRGRGGPVRPVALLAPTASAEPLANPTHTHASAMAVARDLDVDVVINAGAGTGKTYSLVLRYLRILAEGVLPARILCATFTRRAAAEMVHRVRQALLGHTSGPMAEVVAALKADLAATRRIVLSLSTAPITTIDSIGFRLLTEARDAEAELRDEPPPASLRVLDPAAAARELDDHVTHHALAALDRGDPEMLGLVDQLAPDLVLEQLRAAVAGAELDEPLGAAGAAEPDLDATAEAIAGRWWELADLLAGPILAHLRGLDLAALDEALAELDRERLDPSTLDRLDRALAALDRLRAAPTDPGDQVRADLWADLAELCEVPSRVQDLRANKNAPNRPLYEWIQAALVDLPARAGHTDEAQAATKAWLVEHPRITTLSQLAARAARLTRRWQREFCDSLERRGVLRFEDVETRLLERLGDREIAEALADRVPLDHVLVDESQDTSARQVAILEQVAALHRARQFWVGDPKQSIYRFRGAEVDVFADRCELATDAGAVAAHLTVNRRSQAPILAAVNALFAALFPAQRPRVDGAPIALDPRAGALAYAPLVAPEPAPAPAPEPVPAVELYVSPSSGWRFASDGAEPELGDEPEPTALDVMSPTDSELAAVQRIVEILGERGPDRAHAGGPEIAVLASSWAFVARFRRLLAAAGVEAAVEGGRGLLMTPEARSLTDWLDFAVRRDSVSRIAVLRGPGLGVSDAGLYALRLLADPPGSAWTHLDRPPTSSGAPDDRPSLDVDAAIERWAAADPSLDRAAVRALLVRDAAAIERFRATWAWLRCGLGHRSSAELLAELADRLGLWALWRELGRQTLANAEATLELLRQVEATLGVGPRRLVRHLDAIRDRSDPPADGIEADAGAAVVVTTVWQAKGREWPVVVLPELQHVKVRRSPAGLGAVRLVRGYDDGRPRDAVRVPEIRDASPRSPFASDTTAITSLLDLYRSPQDRAELRRLLYVAMTRPKRRLILTATVAPPRKPTLPPAALAGLPIGDGGLDEQAASAGVFSLSGAKSWAQTVQVATELSFVGPDQPRFGPGSVWTPSQVALAPAGPLARRVVLRRAEPEPASAGASALELAASIARLTPITAPALARVNPSALPALATAPAYERLGGGAPELPASPFPSAAVEGTAVHAVLERWCFGAGGQLDAEFVTAALTELGLLTPGREPEQVARVLAVWAANTDPLIGPIAELHRAAARGEVLHELPVRARTRLGEGEGEVEGRIDLLWRDGDTWTVVDYKDVRVVDHREDDSALRKHAAQVELYADLVGAERRAVWYLRAGEIVRWSR